MALRILIADDNEINRAFLIGVLRSFQHEIAEAEDGNAAISRCREQRFDIVLMDIRMPGVDGIQATQRIRDIPGYEQTPIVALTADLQVRQRDALMAHGFAATLAKPVSRQILLDVLSSCVDGAPPPAPEPDPGEPPIDRQIALSATGGNRELVERLTDMLARELAQFEPAIAAAMDDKQLDSAREMVHKLRASAGYCGAGPLQSAAAAFEEALSAGDAKEIDRRRAPFEREISRLRRYLEA